ncbi:hypothetical protein ACFLR0_01510 [Candidatus Bipolaricaulota bacterium]
MVSVRLALGTLGSLRISLAVRGGAAQPISVEITQTQTACALQASGCHVPAGRRPNTAKNSKGSA